MLQKSLLEFVTVLKSVIHGIGDEKIDVWKERSGLRFRGIISPGTIPKIVKYLKSEGFNAIRPSFMPLNGEAEGVAVKRGNLEVIEYHSTREDGGVTFTVVFKDGSINEPIRYYSINPSSVAIITLKRRVKASIKVGNKHIFIGKKSVLVFSDYNTGRKVSKILDRIVPEGVIIYGEWDVDNPSNLYIIGQHNSHTFSGPLVNYDYVEFVRLILAMCGKVRKEMIIEEPSVPEGVVVVD